MRISAAVRKYVRNAVLAKVKDRVEAAEKARAAAIKERDDKVAAAKALAERLALAYSQEFAAEVAELVGLTWIPDTYDYGGNVAVKNGNKAFVTVVSTDDFAETVTVGNNARKGVKSDARTRFDDVVSAPDRIREAAEAAADRLLFELELGKVAKKELDEVLGKMEVKL